ncbi:hypothetical protein F511_30685 [Dorcoceras hygrometricum]|uniref:Uncharacterized protein n=1 Tax=Dorcoceras hygrometricum TaxID=472368 RepID=A0A2Z7CGQ6_9LAMI|nr:hypothetical protein F511_30685 [Dorcoceras hygrometricum]
MARSRLGVDGTMAGRETHAWGGDVRRASFASRRGSGLGGRTVNIPTGRWRRMSELVGFVGLDRFGSTGPIEHAEPLGSLGLNGAGDDPTDEYIPTGGEDL